MCSPAVNDFGWGLNQRSLPELKLIGELRRVAWDCAKEYGQRDEGKEDGFTWTGITIGNPIDWVSRVYSYICLSLSLLFISFKPCVRSRLGTMGNNPIHSQLARISSLSTYTYIY